MLIIILIFGSAVLLSTTFLFIAEGFYMHKSYLDPWNKSYYKQSDDARTQLIAHGILAANGHNMQNWKFKYSPNDDNEFDMYIETKRLATEVDPYYTQATISQGTMFEYMVLAGEKLGYDLKIELFPDGEYSKNASIEELKEKRVARVELAKNKKKQSPLYDETFKPDTSRVAYKKGLLSPKEIELLKSMNNFNDIRVVYIGNGKKYGKIKNYILESAETESGIERLMLESVKLFRKNEREKNEYRYGFSFEGSAVTGFKMHLMQSLLTLFPGMNNIGAAKDEFIAQTKMAAEDNSGFFLIISKGDSRKQQFNAGRLYSKIQLEAHTLGLAVQPLSQAIEEYPEMKNVYDNIHKDMAEEDETILMLFRIGKPVSEVTRSMRMDVNSFIEK